MNRFGFYFTSPLSFTFYYFSQKFTSSHDPVNCYSYSNPVLVTVSFSAELKGVTNICEMVSWIRKHGNLILLLGAILDRKIGKDK